jgi:integrase
MESLLDSPGGTFRTPTAAIRPHEPHAATAWPPCLPTDQQHQRAGEEWYVRCKHANGKWQRKKVDSHKDAMLSMAVRIDRQDSRQQEGLVDPLEEHHRRPFVEHLEDSEKVLLAKGVPNDSAKAIVGWAKRICEACWFQKIGDISASKVQTYVGALRKVIRRKKSVVDGGPLSAQSRNHYLQAINQSTRWLVRDHRTADNRLAHLRKYNVGTDRRHDRRPLSVDEFRRLIDAAASGPPIETIPAPDRARLYILAAWTGYRRKELASLNRHSFDLAGDPPTLRVLAAYSKNKRSDEIPLRPFVVE